MHSKKFIYEVFRCREAIFQDLSKHFWAFCFNQTMKRFKHLDKMRPLYELSCSLSQILFHYLHLRGNPKYMLQEVIVYHYRFLSSKAYQNKNQVIGTGPGVHSSISWVVDLEVFGPGSRILGSGSRVLDPESRVLGSGSWVLILDYVIVRQMQHPVL